MPVIGRDDTVLKDMGGKHGDKGAPCGACEAFGGCVPVTENMNDAITLQQQWQLDALGPPPSSHLVRKGKKRFHRLVRTIKDYFLPSWMN